MTTYQIDEDQLGLTCQIRYLGHETLITLQIANKKLLNQISNQPIMLKDEIKNEIQFPINLMLKNEIKK